MPISTNDFKTVEQREDEQIERLHERIRDRGDIPHPQIIETDLGNKRALCPECKNSTLIEGYVIHYLRSHGKTLEKWAPKDEIAPVAEPHIAVSRAKYDSWHEKHRAAHNRILAKYGNRMLK